MGLLRLIMFMSQDTLPFVAQFSTSLDIRMKCPIALTSLAMK